MSETKALLLLTSLLELFRRTSIIIDGLNEVDDEERKIIFNALEHLPASILVLSRPMRCFADSFPSATTLSIQGRTDDIERFTFAKLWANRGWNPALKQGTPAALGEIAKAIARDSAGS